ncbi:MAG TPA: ABC transporter substrate-binding protein [Ruminiclostridium sp.]|nr:ABC transporter substrate-binding protein [Ruminiclostridium sp.]
MKKKLIAMMAMAVLATGLAACSSNEADITNANAPASAGSSVSASAGPSESAGSSTNMGTGVEGVLTIGFDQDFPPMGFIGEDGEFTGFDLDLAGEVAERLGLELKLQPIAWDSKDMELESKNIDCIWNGFTINKREDDYTWTTPYMANNQVFVVKADSNIKSLADLAGKTVVVQVDSSAEAALKDKPELVGTFGDYMTAANYNTALMDLEAGAVDAVAMDDIVASYQIEKRGGQFVVLEESLAAEDYGVGFLLGNETLRDQVQSALEEMAADGKLAEISNKWFGKDITTIGK